MSVENVEGSQPALGEMGTVNPPASSTILDSIESLLHSNGMSDAAAGSVAAVIAAAGIACVAYLSFLLTRKCLTRAIHGLAKHSKNKWDDALVSSGLFDSLSQLVPGLVIYVSAGLFPALQSWTERIAFIYMLVVMSKAVYCIGKSIEMITSEKEWAKKRPIKVYLQVVTILIYVVIGIVIVATLMDKNPLAVFAGMGALTAVLMLVFKDTILGFVAGIQLAAHDMVRVGDWIVMPKHGADGDVIDISVNTVKVQNWDKTISTIPTYALVSDSFKNWRGMSESGGRRIKRSLSIDMQSISFCGKEELETFKKFELIRDYLESKIKEIDDEKSKRSSDEEAPINGRRLTNVGTFRAYVEAYLRNHPNIHKDMTFLVRQLPPGESGLPVELYVFSNDQVWANYEAIQADIFDHLLACIPEFGLRVFQNPTGADFLQLASGNKG